MPELGSWWAGPAFNAGSVAGTSGGTVVTTGVSNTKGSYAQLIASTTYPAAWIAITLGRTNSTWNFLVDVAIDTATESVVIPNLAAHYRFSDEPGATYLFPMHTPAGAKLSARAQCASATSARTIEVSCTLVPGSFAGPVAMSPVVAYGITTATSYPATVDPGATANTKGAYVQMTASTTYPIRWLNVVMGGGAETRAAAQRWLVDVAIGAATESIILPDLFVCSGSTFDTPLPAVYAFPVSIKAGERIAVRAQCDVNTATERNLYIGVYGVG